MKKEAVSLLGLAALIFTFPFSFLTLKPNRVAEPQGFGFVELPPLLVVPIVAIIVIIFLMVLVRGLQTRLVVRAALAGLLIPLAMTSLQSGALAIMTRLDWSTGRAGPSIGFFAAAGGAYIVLYDCLRRADVTRLTRTVIGAGVVILTLVVLLLGPSTTLGIAQEYVNRQGRFWQELVAHLALSFGSVAGATIIGVPLGVWAFRGRRAEKPIFSITNGLQTIPSLALFGLLIAPLAFLSRQFPFLRAIGIRGVGSAPAVIALVLYGLLPVVRNTYIGLKSIDRGVVEAGRGMGMSRRELLRMVQIPIALPIILTGLRITAVQTIGNAAVAALIGARGLGNFVFQGLGQAAPDLIVLGVIPIVILAIVVDRGMDALIRAVRPGHQEIQ